MKLNRLGIPTVLVWIGISYFQSGWAEPNKSQRPKQAASRTLGMKTGELRSDNALKMPLVWCPEGSFKMGNPTIAEGRNGVEQRVRVRLTSGFWIGQTEVTEDQFETVMKSAPWKGKPRPRLGGAGNDLPATYIDRDEAMAFCKRLTEIERESGRLPDEWEYTLPTEAQWEYACRAGTETRFSFGDSDSDLGDYAWFAVNASKIDEQGVSSVGQRRANPWGLRDMHGNVREWCRDTYKPTLPGGDDPDVTAQVPSEYPMHVVRGGGWRYPAKACQSAFRDFSFRADRDCDVGSRVALCQIAGR